MSELTVSPDQDRLMALTLPDQQATAQEVSLMAEELWTRRRRDGQKTLWDEYAMETLNGLLARPSSKPLDIERTINLVVRYADAMMEVRKHK